MDQKLTDPVVMVVQEVQINTYKEFYCVNANFACFQMFLLLVGTGNAKICKLRLIAARWPLYVFDALGMEQSAHTCGGWERGSEKLV